MAAHSGRGVSHTRRSSIHLNQSERSSGALRWQSRRATADPAASSASNGSKTGLVFNATKLASPLKCRVIRAGQAIARQATSVPALPNQANGGGDGKKLRTLPMERQDLATGRHGQILKPQQALHCNGRSLRFADRRSQAPPPEWLASRVERLVGTSLRRLVCRPNRRAVP
mmetsp:Transcript_13674/g.43710  ORF Transcript_13674/g.43710 Transcript_13674/m.43710 type:complete len:171 (-) Transcript_13674:2999-3511(-)